MLSSLELEFRRSYRKHLQISCTLNLAAQILEKKFFERNHKKSKVKSLEVFFIHCSSNIKSLLTFKQKSTLKFYPQF